MDFKDLKADAILKYNNIVKRLKKSQKRFSGNNISSPKVESKESEAKIVALTTELNATKKVFQAIMSSHVSGGQLGNNSNTTYSKGNIIIPEWCMKKMFEDSVFQDRKQFYWCPEHKYEGKYDGLYITHAPEKHGEWRAYQEAQKQNKRDKWSQNNSGNNTASTQSSAGKIFASGTKLVFSNKMKQALFTNRGFTDLQLENLINSGN